MNRLFFLLLSFLSAIALFAGGQEESSPSVPERVISLGPNITETVFALGCGDRLVGRTDFCDYPEEARQIESVGTLTDPSLEKIILLAPDLVIASTHVKPEILKTVEETGIPVLYLYSEESFEGVYSLIESTADALDVREEGQKIILEMKDTVERVRRSVEGREKPRVYYVISYGEYGDYTAGGNTFIGRMIEMAGAENIASDLEGWRFSLEELIEQDPELLICSRYGHAKEGLADAAGYRELEAVKKGRIFTIDNNKLDRQGPRLAEGLLDLARIIHGDVF